MQKQILMNIYKYSTSIIKHNPKTLPYVFNYAIEWLKTTMFPCGRPLQCS